MKTQKIKIISSLTALALLLPFVSSAFFGFNSHRATTVEADERSDTTINENINTRPTISGISAPTKLNVGETGTWKIQASDPAQGTLSYSVNWGEHTMLPMSTFAEPVYVQSSEFTHAYGTAGTYMITFIVKNDSGATATSRVSVHVGPYTPVNAPVISNVAATKIKQHEATITWSTDTRASGLLWFGTAANVDTSGKALKSEFFRGTSHSIKIKRLVPGTTYYVVVGSENSGGRTLSSTLSFTTAAKPESNDDHPVITSLSGQSKIAVGATEIVTVNAYDPHNGTLSYSADWGDSVDMNASRMAELPVVQNAEFSHVYMNPGTYTARFTVTNSAGKHATSTMTITVNPLIR